MKIVFVALRHAAEDENLTRSLKAKNEALENEKHRLESQITCLKHEVEQHKITADEQRKQALDLKRELREV